MGIIAFSFLQRKKMKAPLKKELAAKPTEDYTFTFYKILRQPLADTSLEKGCFKRRFHFFIHSVKVAH